MGDFFSQNPNNNMFDNTKTDEKKIKNYDFKAPQKFTKEDLKLIRDIYEVYARMVSSYLTGLTRLYCHARVTKLEEQSYFDFSHNLDEYVIMGIVSIKAENKIIIETESTFQFSNDITFSLIDRLMGGKGEKYPVVRDFTEIEMAIMKSILEKMSSFFQEAWSGYINVTTDLLRIETNARLSRSIAPEETVITAEIEVELNGEVSTMSLCMPALSMEEIMSNFTAKYNRLIKQNKIDDDRRMEQRDNIMKGVKNSSLKVQAILAETNVDLSDIISLQINDIIPLDVPITQNALVKVNGVHWFNAKPGISNNKKAIKIVEVCKKD